MSETATPFRLRDPRQFLALGFGSGLAPRAPGTVGSLAALPIVWPLALLPLPYYLTVVFGVVILGIWVCGATARAVGVHDHRAIVWDEIAGMLIAAIALPLNLWTLTTAFVLFRLFDTVKPWPIRWVDRHVGGGWGIMADDVLAGLAALVCGHGFAWYAGLA